MDTPVIFQQKSQKPGLLVRYTQMEDAPHLHQWLSDPDTSRWFPTGDPPEIEGAAQHWVSFSKFHSSLTAEYEGVPCAMAILFLQSYKKLTHQCMHVIVVAKEFRRQGIGSALLEDLHHLAKDHFGIELIHTEIYDGCPAYGLYRKFGYQVFGRQEQWIKDYDGYLDRIMMERFLL